ncbi:hypothetical protein NQ315_003278 [Exocentrus adspersus]|uniref:Uncharacterized protein n=1 Tax=Exocentrus adspersus TaxID=1586481 RepID=A0AAV8VDT6_9CUCU|nr:hypothetical protein NQ315_003278 [Exocentrus adspersus]
MPSTSSATKQSASEEERQNREGKPCALLKEVGVTREIHLTPKARTLYHRATKLTKTVRTLKGRRSKLPRRQLYKQFNKDEVLDQITSPMLNSVVTFVRCQINQSTRKSHGRRYTLVEKILGLILHKQSGRAYKTMEKMFYLPSRRTLSTLLSRIPINAGINEPIFDNLKANIMLLQPRDRLCTQCSTKWH